MENGTSKPKSKTKDGDSTLQPYDFSINVPFTEYQDDDYEKVLEKEIEEQCQFKVYIDKLELDNKTDEELLSLSKDAILSFKNKQIEQLKAFISSLEQEKDDLIDNFKETTSLLLERIKDIEFQSKGFRPETPMITKNLSKKKGGIAKGDFKSLQVKNPIERCPNCHLEVPVEQFVAHSLQCLRKAFNCKACNELVNEDNKRDHLNKYRSGQSMIKAINDNDERSFQLGLDHGFQINSIIDQDKGEGVIHLTAKKNSISLMKIVSKQKSVNMNLLNKVKETPLMVAITHKCEAVAMFLLNAEVDFKNRNAEGRTPLLLSCQYGLKTVVEQLLILGADINETNILGETPVTISQKYEHEALMMMLLTMKSEKKMLPNKTNGIPKLKKKI